MSIIRRENTLCLLNGGTLTETVLQFLFDLHPPMASGRELNFAVSGRRGETVIDKHFVSKGKTFWLRTSTKDARLRADNHKIWEILEVESWIIDLDVTQLGQKRLWNHG